MNYCNNCPDENLFRNPRFLPVCGRFRAPAEKAVSVILLSATSKIPWEPGIKKPERTFQVVLGFSNPGPGKIIGSRKEGIRLEIRDSTGGGNVPSDYVDFLHARDPEFRMETEDWVPAPDARWVSVKGNMLLVTAEKEVTSEGCLFSMDKEKEERHVVLKGGSLMDDGRQGDAQATLKITRSLNKDSGKKNLNVERVSSRMLGICGVTLMKPDGTPVMGKNWSWGYSSGSGGSLSWEWDYRLEPEEKGEIQVLVNYMTELKRIDVPVDLKFGLSGMVRETSRQRKP